MEQYTFQVSKSTQVYTKGTLSKSTKQIWLLLHGYGQLAEEFLEKFNTLNDEETFLIAPEALSKFYIKGGKDKIGASWMTRHHRSEEIEDYVHYLDQVITHYIPKGSPIELHILGFSQGASTASHWLEKSSIKQPKSVTFWAGNLSPGFQKSLHEGRYSDINFHFVNGRQDRFIPNDVIDTANQLAKGKPNISLNTFDGGHEINEALLMQLKERT